MSETLATTTAPRLTSLSHGGGCGCKIAPGILAQLIGQSTLPTQFFPDLLVGTETADDAAVYRINEHQAIVATTDFFMPIVDDPHDFGRIAATNALSDIYAMGATPLMALAIVGMPINVLPHSTIAAILEGGASVCRAAGIPLAGGHSIDSVEPIYGLVAIGIVDPRQLKRNADAQAGDVLILGKPLGVGILSAALKKELLDATGYAAMISATTQLNRPGPDLAQLPGVHALTDVTGFGLLGHALEMAKGAQLTACIDAAALPLLPGIQNVCRAGRGHRCLRAQLGRVWRARRAGRAHQRQPAGGADRSANLRRPAGIVPPRSGRAGAGDLYPPRLWCRPRDWHDANGPSPSASPISAGRIPPTNAPARPPAPGQPR